MLLLVLAESHTATMLTTILNLLGGCTLVLVLGLWISLAIWAWQDSRARLTDGSAIRRPCPRGPRFLNLQWQFCHRSRSDARGPRAWSRSFPSAPALDLDWKHHLNRKRKPNNKGVKKP